MEGSQSVISSIQHRAVPPAGSTSVFQSAERCRPVRQRTSQHQAMVAAKASTKVMAENSGTKPGTSRATLAAGLGGTPVCIATQ